MYSNHKFRLLLDLYWVVPLWQNELNVWVIDILYFDKLAFDTNFVPVPDLADVRTVKIVVEVSIAHPEGAITIVQLDLLSHFEGPLITVRSPVAISVKLAPLIPNL